MLRRWVARDGHAQVVPVGAVSKGLDGAELAELGLMARSSAGVRVFSDDGHCVCGCTSDATSAGVRPRL